MSEFFRALGQAERDRALREQGRGRPSTPSAQPPAPATSPVEEAAAPALAQEPETRVLLIDADLRRPSIAEKFGLQVSPSPGLVGGLLDRGVTIGNAVRRRPPFNLDILPAGDTPAAPYELLRSARLT